MLKYLVYFVLLICLPLFSAQQFRADYVLYHDPGVWLKFHRVPATWRDARLRCELEGATLASPTSLPLRAAMVDLMNASVSDQRSVFTGIHSTISQGDYYSIEGVPLSMIPVIWAPNEPDNHEGCEECLLLNPNGTMADVKCGVVHSYICYRKNTKNMPSMNDCGTIDSNYRLEPRTGSCYKYHTVARSWARAFMTCSAEGGYLAIPNSAEEAKIFKELFLKNPYSTGPNKYTKVVFLGFQLIDGIGWRTLHGETLEEAGFAVWETGSPNNASSPASNWEGENCGCIDMSSNDNGLDDMWCGYVQPFICEKQRMPLDEPSTSQRPTSTTTATYRPTTSTSTTTHRPTTSTSTTTHRPTTSTITTTHPPTISTTTEDIISLLCDVDNGYHFEPRTDSCYKHHTGAKTWTNALTTCSSEGGYLAIVNSAVEAQVFKELFMKNPYSPGVSQHSTDVFFGFQLDGDDGRWKTIFNETIEEAGYAVWAEGEPNGADVNGETCGSIKMSRNPIGLNDIWCGHKQPFFCEMETRDRGPINDQRERTSTQRTTTTSRKPTTTTQKSTPYIPSSAERKEHENLTLSCEVDNGYRFEPRTGSCYKYYNVAANQSDAYMTCLNEGGYLAIVNSAVEAQVFKELFMKNPFSPGVSQHSTDVFFGFQLDTDDGRWKTIFDETIEEAGYAVWAEGEPNGADANGEHTCGSINMSRNPIGLNDIWCGFKQPFFCEMETRDLGPIKNQRERTSTQRTTTTSRKPTTATQKLSPYIPSSSAERKEHEYLTLSCKVDNGYRFEPRTGSCYKYYNVAANQSDAYMTCLNEGGYLAIVNSAVEAQVFKELFMKNPFSPGVSQHSTDVFFGFQLDTDDGRWKTIFDETIEEAGYAVWAEGEPNGADANGEHTCGSINMSRNPIGLNDIWCGFKQPFFCEMETRDLGPIKNQRERTSTQRTTTTSRKPTTATQKLSPYIPSSSAERKEHEYLTLSCKVDNGYRFEPRTGSCYKYYNVAANQSDAYMTCLNEGGYLAIVNSAVEAQVFKELFMKNPFSPGVSQHSTDVFFGFQLDTDDGRWKTIFDETIEEAGYAVWAEGEPNGADANGEHTCGSINMSRNPIGLNDIWCGFKQPFFCEMETRDLGSINDQRERTSTHRTTTSRKLTTTTQEPQRLQSPSLAEIEPAGPLSDYNEYEDDK